ncbi:ribonuclease H-like domain-containing protein [Tanacetum coccineum]
MGTPSVRMPGNHQHTPNNDFLTRRILLRCDNSRNLYPVTKPSTIPTTFPLPSSSTWHQHLGHPGDEVLRSLASRQFISCNKENSTHVCHAFQLGKHVKLPFHKIEMCTSMFKDQAEVVVAQEEVQEKIDLVENEEELIEEEEQ